MRLTPSSIAALAACSLSLLAIGLQARAQAGHTDSLTAGFAVPPASAKPWVYWHWMNGNVTQPGITADLEWMQRIGIGGALLFEAGGGLANYQIITPQLIYGDANWQAAIHHAASTSDRLGIELATAASPGWSETGGPWVKPFQAMKKYVWSETLIAGDQHYRAVLPHPPTTTGAFQNAPTDAGLGAAIKTGAPEPAFYADALVVAYRVPDATTLVPRLSISATAVEPAALAKLSDNDFNTTLSITAETNQALPWIQASYAQPVTIRGVSLGMTGMGASGGATPPQLLTSDDGQHWRSGTTLRGPTNAVLKTYGIAPLRAQYFRLLLPPPLTARSLIGAPLVPPAPGPVPVKVSEFALLTESTVDRFVDKAGFAEPVDYAASSLPAADDAVIKPAEVIDLTRKMRVDGSLDWQVPPGQWRVLRLGYSLTGKQNHPAQVQATGLEVDKFSRTHITSYLKQYLDQLQHATGPELMGKRGLRMIESDSWEAGTQNWTDDFPAQFKRRRGYDLLPWVPVLTGRIVQSTAASDKFLWDFRRTLQDLLAQHYQILAEQLHRRGLQFYAEAQGDTWRAIGDGMEMKRHADVPMAEYWQRSFAAGVGQPTLKTDMKEAASVANLYGRQRVANESLTLYAHDDPWSFSPAMMKPVLDEIFAYGVNQIVLHSSVHQPDPTKKPGLTLGPFGQYFNRHETWAEQAKPFMDYIARTSYLLQQGRYVADIAYFYGEDKPLVGLFTDKFDAATQRYAIEVPDGYGYDFVNAEALREEFSVRNAVLHTRSGMQYRLLYLHPDIKALTLPTAQKILQLVQGGAVLLGQPIHAALGLSASDLQVQAIAQQLWGTQPASTGKRSVSRGTVYWGMSLQSVLQAENITPDVNLRSAPEQVHLMQVHRRLPDGTEIYFISNRSTQATTVQADFRVTGRVPELWRADSGEHEALSYRMADGRTAVSLDMQPHDAVFVVFRHTTPLRTQQLADKRITRLSVLDGAWQLSFPETQGTPRSMNLPLLASWTDSDNASVKYFSGTVTYQKRFEVQADWLHADTQILLDLGSVHELAEVSINGRVIGTVWQPPYTLPIKDALHAGSNELTLRVTNLWANRLIGDARSTATKYTWTTADLPETQRLPALLRSAWSADAALLPSGLLGPVQLLQVTHSAAP